MIQQDFDNEHIFLTNTSQNDSLPLYGFILSLLKNKQNMNIFTPTLLSVIHINEIYLLFARMEERCGGAIGESDVDVMTSEEQRVGPCSLFGPPPVRRDTSYQGGRRRGSSSSYIFSSSTIPSTRPVWWILFSALLSWVIWGIIPKVSKPSRSVKF